MTRGLYITETPWDDAIIRDRESIVDRVFVTIPIDRSELLMNDSSMETSSAQVCVRLRPPNSKESIDCLCITVPSPTEICCAAQGSDTSHVFQFDRVLDETATQIDVYSVVRPTIEDVLRGINGTVFTYGQTGSGKTHTLIGSLGGGDGDGIVPRAASDLMCAVEKEEGFFSVIISLFEIYCERICDLLEPSNQDLRIKADGEKGIHVAGLSEVAVQSEAEMREVIQWGLSNRAIGSTAMNAQSSRSHCILTIQIQKQENNHQVPYGKLCMVDLAGSERQSKTDTSGIQLDEGILINKSLSALANVICALTDGRGRHVPYRDSKLTRVLQDAIGGNSKTILIVCCAPAADDLPETLSSLRFGSRARGIVNTIQPKSQQTNVDQEWVQCQQEIERLRAELEALRNKNADSGVGCFFGDVKLIMRKEISGFEKCRLVMMEIKAAWKPQCKLHRLLHFLMLLLVFLLEDYLFRGNDLCNC